VGERTNRRHRPGRALERTSYRFDVVSDYGAFRDLQRHRMLTIEWQELTPRHGYDMPAVIAEAGFGDRFEHTMTRSADLHALLAERCPAQAAYAVALAFRIRYSMQMNAREAMHVVELRSGEQGHPAYRAVAQQMHTLIAQRAGHRVIADAMSFVDHEDHDLERLGAERRAEVRRTAAAQS
jgi:thymidylate synthase ThyX